MSYIVRAGNLAATPELRTADSGGVYCYADVIVNDRERLDDGSYRDLATTRYSLTVFRSAAEQLVATAETSGNVRVMFAGRYRVREYNRRDGGTGISHDVVVDEIGVSLTGQRVAVDRTRRSGGEGTPAEGGQ
ncbi:MAG: single-stranded DNA-binding protein [Microlunatus sp.]|nr:single-stranded DNA-binding protein [Microlunatus sp.]